MTGGPFSSHVAKQYPRLVIGAARRVQTWPEFVWQVQRRRHLVDSHACGMAASTVVAIGPARMAPPAPTRAWVTRPRALDSLRSSSPECVQLIKPRPALSA